jgi:hypothetical protein
MWLELEIDTDGDSIRVSGRGSRGERPSPHTLPRETGARALSDLHAGVGAAILRNRPLDPSVIAPARSLHEQVFRGELRDVLVRLGEAAGDGRVLVRLFVSDRALQGMPWEALCRPGTAEGFLATDPRVLVARGVASAEPWRPRRVEGAVRLLAIAPGERGGSLEILKGALQPAIESGAVEWMEPVTGDGVSARALFSSLRSKKSPHIVHFLGHGGVDREGRPVLRLSDDEDGEEAWLTAEALARELAASFSEDLRLVTLEACEGGKPGALGSAAEILARAGADAVVAFSWPVRASVARAFSAELYGALTASERTLGDVGAAVSAARRTLLSTGGDAFSPVLYLRGSDSAIFDFRSRRLAHAGRPSSPGRGAPAARPSAPASPALAARVFVSCRGDVPEDLEIALALHDALSAASVPVFLAQKSVREGDSWVSAAAAALRGAELLLLVLTRRASVSEMVAAELLLARELAAIGAGKPRVLAVRARFPEAGAAPHPLSEQLQDVPHVAWNGPFDTAAVVQSALARLASDGGALPPSLSPGPRPSAPRSAPASAVQKSSLELPGGAVSLRSPYYVVRPAIEEDCLREIEKPGALLRIKAPRQMGKTSLMMRILDHAAAAGAQTVTVNLQMADAASLGDLDRLLRWMCAVVTRRLKLPARKIDDAWDDIFGAKDNCSAYFEEQLLPACETLVLALDHVDRLFEHPATAEEVLALLRAWHEMSKSQEGWDRLRLVLSYSTEMYLPMNINRSPFNVGLPAVLLDWDGGMVSDLARRHGLDLGAGEIDRLMGLLGGHPHLVRLVLYHVAGGASLDDVIAAAPTDQGLFADHLKYLLWQVERQPGLREAAARLMAAEGPIRLGAETTFKLTSLGLSSLHGNDVRPARELYRRYFDGRLGAP